MEFLKIMLLCLTAGFICIFFMQYKKEYAAVIAVIIGGIILTVCLKQILTPLNTLADILNKAGVSLSYFSVAVKAVALGYITGFVADTCRDFGCGSIASKAEFAGKVSVFIICVPLIEELFGVITELV